MKKILLIHGWNYLNYSSSGCTDAWANRHSFIDGLRKYFEVKTFNLPGFCGAPDPVAPWKLSDYASFVNTVIEKEKPDIILGYSFGGAIALHWKLVYRDKAIKTFLVSPAIIRQYTVKNRTRLQSFFKALLPEKIVRMLRDIYLSTVRKNLYYSRATPIMRDTYRNIITIDLQTELTTVDDSLVLIYGEKDTATPPGLVWQAIEKSLSKHVLEIIPGGGHDIANSHTDTLISLITKNGGV